MRKISVKKTNLYVLVLSILTLAGSLGMVSKGCTPEQLSIWSIAQVFGNGSVNTPLAGEAISVALCESGLNPYAWNGGCCYGLFQINRYYHEWRVEAMGYHWDPDIYNPLVNTLVAKQIYDEAGGWGPWQCKP